MTALKVIGVILLIVFLIGLIRVGAAVLYGLPIIIVKTADYQFLCFHGTPPLSKAM